MIWHGEIVAVRPVKWGTLQHQDLGTLTYYLILYSILPPTMIFSSISSFLLSNGQFEFDKDLILVPDSEKNIDARNTLADVFCSSMPLTHRPSLRLGSTPNGKGIGGA